MITEDYKSFECVKNLGEYKERFIRIVDVYAKELNNRIIIGNSVYTMHDFDNHCTDIYKIISEVLLDPSRAYTTNGLTAKELYILDLAVLFHDISMSRDIMAVRENHSMKSAEYIQELYNNTESVLYKESGLTQNEVKALKLIVKAHSDVKIEDINPKHRGLNDPSLNDKMPARRGVIRAKLLAGILRLADELDITNDRLGNTNLEKDLNTARVKYADLEMKIKSGEGAQDKDEYEKYKKYVESLLHWEKLHYFSQIERERQDDTVYLVTDDEYIQHLLDEGETVAEITRKITESYKKILKEWESIKKITIEDSLQKLDIKSFFPISTIELKCELPDIKREIEKQDNVDKMTNPYVEEGTKIEEQNDKKSELIQVKSEVQLLDEELSKRLKKEVDKRHLLKVGHFLLDDEFCARDWIDTKEIVETKTLSDKVVSCFIEQIKRNCDMKKKYLIVGLDLEGALLTARIAMGLKMPFSYIVPVRKQLKSSIKESEISLSEYDGIILVTDVIVAFDTIKKALEELRYKNSLTSEQISEKVVQVYSVFYRDSELLAGRDLSDLKKKTFCANKDYLVELFPKKDCHYIKEGKCLAINSELCLG